MIISNTWPQTSLTCVGRWSKEGSNQRVVHCWLARRQTKSFNLASCTSRKTPTRTSIARTGIFIWGKGTLLGSSLICRFKSQAVFCFVEYSPQKRVEPRKRGPDLPQKELCSENAWVLRSSLKPILTMMAANCQWFSPLRSSIYHKLRSMEPRAGPARSQSKGPKPGRRSAARGTAGSQGRPEPNWGQNESYGSYKTLFEGWEDSASICQTHLYMCSHNGTLCIFTKSCIYT